MPDCITDYWREELVDAFAPFHQRGVTVSVCCQWIDLDYVCVTVGLDGQTVLSGLLWGTGPDPLDQLADLLWSHRLDLLARLREVGASQQSLHPFLERASWRGLSVVM